MILDIFRKGKRGKSKKESVGKACSSSCGRLIGFVCHFFFTRGASPILNSILLFLVALALTCFGLVLLPLFQLARGFAGLFNDRYTLKCKRTDARCVSAVLLIKQLRIFLHPLSFFLPLSLSISQSLYLSSSLTVISLFTVFFFARRVCIARHLLVG